MDKISLNVPKSFDEIARFPPTEINKEENPSSEDEPESNNSLISSFWLFSLAFEAAIILSICLTIVFVLSTFFTIISSNNAVL